MTERDKQFELLNNGLRSESEKLFLYACNKLQSRYYPFTDSFHQYLKLINDKDSVFNLLLKVYPDYSNDELKYIVSSIELPDSKYDTAYILTIKDGYTDELWLFPNGGEDYYAKQFGLSTFNPIIYNAITRLSDSEIESIPSAAIIRSVKEDELFLQESLTTGLRISGIPELSNQFSLLRDKDDFSIAAEKDKLIKEILKLKKNYLLAGLKYMYSRYVIDGKCFIEKENYDFNAQHINVHLSISAWPDGGIYVATMRVPLSLEDAQTLFAENESFWVTVQYKVSPGVTIQNLGISGGGVPNWRMQDLYLVEEPKVSFVASGKQFAFRTIGLQGYIWSGAETGRWDLHKENRPYHGGYAEARIVTGTDVTGK